MKMIDLGKSGLLASEISLGCMRIAKLPPAEAATLVRAALDAGINFFEHADIYGAGKSEEVFAEAVGMSPAVREKILIQSKCGIRKPYFDFSKEHILASVDGSLKRLRTEYLDTLLLHRPDTLVEPDEVAEAFGILVRSGKVRRFGVSNHNPTQIQLLRRSVKEPLILNQLQFSMMHTGMLDAGFNVNMKNETGVVRDGGILDFCRLHDITIQAWSPFQFGFFEGVFVGHAKFPELNKALDAMAAAKGVTPSALAIAWILRHPAKIQPVVGTTNAVRVKEICRASEVELTRAEWYELYRAAGNKLP
jgi:predicted oxidoreductase